VVFSRRQEVKGGDDGAILRTAPAGGLAIIAGDNECGLTLPEVFLQVFRKLLLVVCERRGGEGGRGGGGVAALVPCSISAALKSADCLKGQEADRMRTTY